MQFAADKMSAEVCSQHRCEAMRSLVNTGASRPGPVEAESRVLAKQTKPHQRAVADSGRRFDDLSNLVHGPEFLVTAWSRVGRNKGARTAGVASLRSVICITGMRTSTTVPIATGWSDTCRAGNLTH